MTDGGRGESTRDSRRERDRGEPGRDRDGAGRAPEEPNREPAGERDESIRGRSLVALERARTDGRRHALALAVAATLGVATAWLHWTGLVLAGALVGFVSRDLPRAVVGGLATGALVLAVFALSLGGAAPAAFAMTPASYVTVASGLGLPALGALVRGLI